MRIVYHTRVHAFTHTHTHAHLLSPLPSPTTRYVNFSLPARTAGLVPVNESLIGSGDFFGILRMDGLDPMLAWGMGATTGHTVVGMRDPITDELFIHESQVNSSYCT